MKIVWASNFPHQPTGYARIAREVLPRINDGSDHDVAQFAVSGMVHSMPTVLNGVRTYGPSSQGGTLGAADFPLVDRMENADVWLLNFDAWSISNYLQEMDLRYVLYPPVDHDPIAANWMAPLRDAHEVVPYCAFGKRVIDAALDGEAEKVKQPIYHGVDTETYEPEEGMKEQVFGVSEDVFTIGIFKNNQSTRWAPFKQLGGVKLFIEEYDLWDDVLVYINSPIQGSGTFDLDLVIDRLELGGVVTRANMGRARWGMPDFQLANMYNACDVVLNCTKGEGFGLPIFEAFATATPVIGNAFSSMPELIAGVEGETQWAYSDMTGGLPVSKAELRGVEGVDDDLAEQIYDHIGPTAGPGDISSEHVIDANRGWLVPVWDREATMEKHSWRRTNRAEHIAAALGVAYERPDARETKGEAARKWVSSYRWDDVASRWVDYFDDLEDRLFETDEGGIEWGKVETEKGGVGALGGDRSDD